jgi:uncharacterized membrane protein YdbT with pleckstrin-like domain
VPVTRRPALIIVVLAMRYIERILQPGETVVFRGKLHWIVYFPAIALLLAALAALIAFTQIKINSVQVGLLFVAVACGFIGGFGILKAWFERWTTEIDVTDRRIVYKRGLIWRHTVEMNMDKVESVDVDQSILGRLLDYGAISIHGVGVGLETLRRVRAPLDLRNHVTAR